MKSLNDTNMNIILFCYLLFDKPFKFIYDVNIYE